MQSANPQKIWLLLALLLGLSAPATGQTGKTPDYARLSHEKVVRMGYERFVSRYGEHKLGTERDAVEEFWADCQRERNERRARAQGHRAVAYYRSLRSALERWDEGKTPFDTQQIGGNLEIGHRMARSSVNRERLLAGLLRRPFREGTSGIAEARATVWARRRFQVWLDRQRVPDFSNAELFGNGPEARQKYAARHAAWYVALKRQSHEVECFADALPAFAPAVYRYAVTEPYQYPGRTHR